MIATVSLECNSLDFIMPHPAFFALDRPERVLNFSLFQLKIDVLNVFNSGKVISTFPVLWWFKCLNE